MSSVHLRPKVHGRRGGQDYDRLPKYASLDDKRRRSSSASWGLPVQIAINGRSRNLWVPNLRGLHQTSLSRYGRKRGSLIVFCAYLCLICIIFALAKRFGSRQTSWPSMPSIGEKTTLVYRQEDLQRIWMWEIANGHHPSRKIISKQLGLPVARNPALPASAPTFEASTLATGPNRNYLTVRSHPPNVAYPPRPVPGSIADLDMIMRRCDYTANKYVRDCLEYLRVGAGLEQSIRVRPATAAEWNYVFVEEQSTTVSPHLSHPPGQEAIQRSILRSERDDEVFAKNRHVSWELSPIALPPIKAPRIYSPCNPDESRIFHMYWTGPLTDKPYLSVLSFLFTQNVDLHRSGPPDDAPCRPQLWLWINPDPTAMTPNASAQSDLLEQLQSNMWASPFLHPRFKDVVHFKLWNTTEQLDSVAELKDDWRSMKTLFKSGADSISVPPPKNANGSAGTGDEEDKASRPVSKSSELNDRLSVIMSDMARFVLCHRFGGIYVDADTVFLRDWEELWGWKGAFAYRWSFHEKYNTAVLRLLKGSALGTFILRTALKHDLDFHPMSVSNYLKDAHLEELLYRLPDAMFDSAWLNMEKLQRDRPPQPYFFCFAEFFETPLDGSVASALGFDGFFKGAFSYHFHNSWMRSVDPSRNYPELGPNFGTKETIPNRIDSRDLGWAAVLKRTFEAYVRGEMPNMYGEWLQW